MTTKLILLFSHRLTQIQSAAAEQQLNIEKIIEPPAEIVEIWRSIPPEEERLQPVLTPVYEWLDGVAAPGDYILIQGDFGACYLLVRYCLNKGCVPVYSTTERKAQENHLASGQVELTHIFQHVKFRLYGK